MPNIPIKMNQLSQHNTDIDNLQLIGYKESDNQPIRLASSSFLYNSMPAVEVRILEGTRLFVRHKTLTFPLVLKVLRKVKKGKHRGMNREDRLPRTAYGWYKLKVVDLQITENEDWYEIPDFYTENIRAFWGGNKIEGYKHHGLKQDIIAIKARKYCKFALQVAIQNPKSILGRPQTDYIGGEIIYMQHNLFSKIALIEAVNPWTEETIEIGENWITPTMTLR